jgi:hypothetical protein
MRKWLVLLSGLCSGVLAVAAASAPAASAASGKSAGPGPLPVIYNSVNGFAHASPTASPPGANDWS